MSTRKLVGGIKDEHGAYVPMKAPVVEKPKEEPPTNISIDGLLNRGLRALHGLMRAIEVDIGSGAPSRETVQNLKDAMGMLADLKKKEQDLLEELTDEQLKELITK